MAAGTAANLAFATLLLSLLFLPTNTQEFSRNLSKREMGLKKEKLSHLHFYLHDTVSGPNATVDLIASAAVTNSSATNFGFLVMLDDPLTVGPSMSSRSVGRAQGMYGSADFSNVGLLMVLNFVFSEGKFNGSTLSVVGRNPIFSGVREMPVVGGSGVFRFARGYARVRTHTFDINTGNAIVEYNFYVFHY